MKHLLAQIKNYSLVAKYITISILSLFVISRVLVVLIMSHVLPPWLFLNIGSSHIHHYVYGIFILLTLCTYLLFRKHKITSKEEKITALIYGICVTLIFDEFVYWLTMTNSYYQKLNIDSVIFVFFTLLGVWLAPVCLKVKNWLRYLVFIAVFMVIGLLVCSIANHKIDKLSQTINKLNLESPK